MDYSKWKKHPDYFEEQKRKEKRRKSIKKFLITLVVGLVLWVVFTGSGGGPTREPLPFCDAVTSGPCIVVY